MFKQLVQMLNRPESQWTAGAVGAASALAVVLNVGLTSCEGAGADSSTSSQPRLTAAASGPAKPAPLDRPVLSGNLPARPGTGALASSPRAVVAAPDLPAGPGGPELRVRILTAGTQAQLSAPGSALLISSTESKQALSLPAFRPGDLSVGQQITVSLQGGQWAIVGAPGSGQGWNLPASVSLVISPATPKHNVTLNGTWYPGRLRLTARNDLGDRAFDIIEFVELEDYLPGVVSKEMLTGWPIEAYRVQSVCARTYAMHERQRSIAAGASFDVESSDRDQVYSGATSNQVAIDAVRSTRGQILTWEGQILRAYYSSTCGGRTASARDTWPTGPGFEYNLAQPLQARPREFACHASPLFRWTVSRDRRELVNRLRAFGERQGVMVRQIKDLSAIDPLSFNEDGRPSRFRITEPGGRWFQLSGEELRLALNTSITGGSSGGGGATGPNKPGAGTVAGLAGKLAAAPALASPSSSGLAPSLDVVRQTRVNSSDIDVAITNNNVSITGRGFGHGVGMCQYCAKAFAERGESWQTMLVRFYPGARIQLSY